MNVFLFMLFAIYANDVVAYQPVIGSSPQKFNFTISGFNMSTFTEKDEKLYIAYFKNSVPKVGSVSITKITSKPISVSTSIVLNPGANVQNFSTLLAENKILPPNMYGNYYVVGAAGTATDVTNAINTAVNMYNDASAEAETISNISSALNVNAEANSFIMPRECTDSCPYTYNNKKICGSCCTGYGSRKCSAYYGDYNGCGPGDGNNDGSNGIWDQTVYYFTQFEILYNLGQNGLSNFNPMCDQHDMCFQTPPPEGAGFDNCNTKLRNQLDQVCNDVFNPSKQPNALFYYLTIEKREICLGLAAGMLGAIINLGGKQAFAKGQSDDEAYATCQCIEPTGPNGCSQSPKHGLCSPSPSPSPLQSHAHGPHPVPGSTPAASTPPSSPPQSPPSSCSSCSAPIYPNPYDGTCNKMSKSSTANICDSNTVSYPNVGPYDQFSYPLPSTSFVDLQGADDCSTPTIITDTTNWCCYSCPKGSVYYNPVSNDRVCMGCQDGKELATCVTNSGSTGYCCT